MTRKAILATMCCVLLVCAPVADTAGTKAMGKMNSKGLAEVNGTAAPAEVTVFAGDLIVTRPDGSAALFLSGGSLMILAGSSSLHLQEAQNQLNPWLKNGVLGVVSRGSVPVVVEAGGTRIRPPADGGIYEVVLNGNTLRVIARKGAIEVEAADRTITVSEGKALEATLTPPQGPAGAGAVGGLSTMAKVMLVVVTAATVTGVITGVAALNRSKPQDCTVVSPNQITCP